MIPLFCRIFRTTFFDLLTGSKSRLRFSAHSVPVGVHYPQARIDNQVNRSDHSCRFVFIRGEHHRPRINHYRKIVETQRTQSSQRNGSNNACESAIVSGVNLVNELGNACVSEAATNSQSVKCRTKSQATTEVSMSSEHHSSAQYPSDRTSKLTEPTDKLAVRLIQGPNAVALPASVQRIVLSHLSSDVRSVDGFQVTRAIFRALRSSGCHYPQPRIENQVNRSVLAEQSFVLIRVDSRGTSSPAHQSFSGKY